MKCVCVGCDNPVADSVTGFTDKTQKAMLGYFCKNCIKAHCDSECKNKVAA